MKTVESEASAQPENLPSEELGIRCTFGMELQEMFRYGYMFPPREDEVVSCTYLELPSYSYSKSKADLPPVNSISVPQCVVYDSNCSDGWHTPSPTASLRSVSPATTLSISSEPDTTPVTYRLLDSMEDLNALKKYTAKRSGLSTAVSRSAESFGKKSQHTASVDMTEDVNSVDADTGDDGTVDAEPEVDRETQSRRGSVISNSSSYSERIDRRRRQRRRRRDERRPRPHGDEWKRGEGRGPTEG